MTERASLSPLFIWRTAIGGSTLTPTARHAALALSLYMNDKGGSAFPGGTRLARDTGYSIRTIRKALGELVAAGWLVEVSRGGSPAGGERKATEYRATVPTSAGGSPVNGGDRCISEHRPVHLTTPTGAGGSPQSVKKATQKAREPKSVIPDDFTVSEHTREWARSQSIQVEIDREVEKFINYHQSRGTRMVDWNAGFRKWLHDARPEHEAVASTNGVVKPSPRLVDRDRLIAGAERLEKLGHTRQEAEAQVRTQAMDPADVVAAMDAYDVQHQRRLSPGYGTVYA